jgi:5-methyltetrahydropteroyltriglutamate--homocysteine methyltransferase
MKRSTERILVSHAGSLHRPPDLRDMMVARKDTDPIDDSLGRRIKQAVDEVVREQAQNGVDVVNDGEYSKRSWQTYALGRLGGIEMRPLPPGEGAGNASITARESRFFPEYFSRPAVASSRAPGVGFAGNAVYCVGPVTYTGQAEVQRDIENMKAAVQGANVEEAFLSALAPGTIEHWLRNEYYETDEEYLFAVADAMHEEYRAITDAGFILQLDDPDLPDGFHVYPDLSVEEYRRFADLRVEAMNHALRDCPEDRVRLHICWGSIHHPHTQDIALADIIDLVFKTKAQCYSVEAANPRHEHEWNVFENVRLPDGKIFMPGVLGHAAPEFVEHPELVAQRLVRYGRLIGRENLIAGTDCGLSRVAHPSIMWAKFRAAREGADLAWRRLS